jgi:hypothetical protein
MRRKRIMLVGDSIMRNQWESLVCLVQGVIPTGHKKVTYNGPSMAFHSLVSCIFTYCPSYILLFTWDRSFNLEVIFLATAWSRIKMLLTGFWDINRVYLGSTACGIEERGWKQENLAFGFDRRECKILEKCWCSGVWFSSLVDSLRSMELVR